jgi:hypothetical protein
VLYPNRVIAGIALLAIALVSLAACSAAAQEYVDAGDARELARSACFRVEHLPGDFEIVARLMQDNVSAALTAPDLATRAQEYDQWGRIGGFYNHWAFEPPSMPDEDADGRMTDEEIESELRIAEAEMLAAPFRSATCSVSVYSSEEGARDAFAAELEALLNPEHLAHVTATSTGSVDDIDGSVTVSHQYSAPVLTRYIVLIRQEHIVAEVSISATCGGVAAQDCDSVQERAHSLAILLHNRLAATRTGDDLPNTVLLDGDQLLESSLARARQVCGTRDFSGCVETYDEFSNDQTPFALCRNEQGSWRFETPTGNIGDSCSAPDYIVVDVIGRDRLYEP